MPIRIPYDSNLLYLPLMYFLPEDRIIKFPTLRTLPRKVRDVMYSDEMMEVVNNDAFLNEIMDAVAALAFPHFGFGGWKEHYTGDCPVWKLTYALPVWARLLEQEIGWNLQALMNISSSQEIPFFQPGYIKKVMGQVVKHAIDEEGWQPILDVVKEMPCDEDFEKWDTNVRKNFLRKWYHTRSKWAKMVSLEACLEDGDHIIHKVAVEPVDTSEIIEAEEFAQWFRERLSERDLEMLALRAAGLTYEKIAERMGYKGHSGVLKRINKITNDFLQCEEKWQ